MMEINNNDHKILSFEQNADFYYKLAENALEQQNFLSALEYINRAIHKEYKSDYALLKASIFQEMDLFEESNNEYFSILLKDRNVMQAYMGAANNYWLIDMPHIAAHCIKMAARHCDASTLEEGYLELFKEMRMDEEEDKPDHKELLDMARTFMRLEQFEEVQQILRFIPQTSEYYLEAQNNIALCHLLLNEFKEAHDTIDNILRVEPDNIYAKCTLVSLYSAQKNRQHLSQAVEDLLQYEKSGADDLFKIALTFCELSSHKNAARFFDLYYEKQPFDVVSRIFGAIAHYNSGNRKRAAEVIKVALKIEPENTVLLYYADFFEGEQISELSYTVEVPDMEIKRRFEMLWQADKHNAEEIKPLIKWCFSFKEYDLQEHLINTLIMDSRYDGFFEQLLVDVKVPNICKKEIINSFILNKKKKEICILINELFQDYNINYPKQLKNLPKAFLYAYAEVFSSLVFSLDDFEERLLKYATSFFDECKDLVDEMTDYSAIAACMVYRGKLLKTDRKIRTACAIFGAKQTVVSHYNKLLKEAAQTKTT